MNKYEIKFSEMFNEDLREIIRYIKYNLNNENAANKFYNEVYERILQRAENPNIYEKYHSRLNMKNDFYRIYIKNYIIFYIVDKNIMEFRRILNNRRNLRLFVKEKSEKYTIKQGS